MIWNSAFAFALITPTLGTYVWPSKQDSLDDLLFLQSGYIRNGALSDQVQTCDFGAGQPGIQKAAEWIRTAFHDAATHDASTKIGGLDASIQYELDRAENLGAALNNTLADISSSVNIHSSAADVLALSLVMAVARCGNLHVPLRIGRKDAKEAGIKGVPEAHTDLETTKQRFQIAGFSETEMITLVACGHTVGGVHSVDHPEIVSGPVDPANKAEFDTTHGSFDNKVVTEYLDSSTASPLIRNANNTLNSDKRIFGSDKNATMGKLSNETYFKAQCETLFERMLNLVPGDVTLSEPMVPADIKPYIESYQIKGNVTLEFAGRIRVRTSPDTGRDPASLRVALIPTDRNGSKGAELAAQAATFRGGESFGYLKETFHWFEFNETLKPDQALKTFDVRVNDQIYDNAGTGGFPLNPDVIFQNDHSCMSFDPTTNEGNLTVVAAISTSLLQGEDLSPLMRVVQKTKVQRNFIPRLGEKVVPMTRSSKEVAGYIYFKGSVLVGSDSLDTSFDLEIGDSKNEFISTAELRDGKLCVAV